MTEYENILDYCKKHNFKLKELVPKMYEALTKKGSEAKDVGDKIKRDLLALGWSKEYITRLLPEETKIETEPKKIEICQSQSVTELSNPDGTVLLNKKGDDPTKEKLKATDPDIELMMNEAIQLLRNISIMNSELTMEKYTEFVCLRLLHRRACSLRDIDPDSDQAIREWARISIRAGMNAEMLKQHEEQMSRKDIHILQLDAEIVAEETHTMAIYDLVPRVDQIKE